VPGVAAHDSLFVLLRRVKLRFFAKALVNLSMPNISLEQEVIAAPLRLRFVHCIYTLQTYTNTARSTEAEQRLCSEALTSEVGLL